MAAYVLVFPQELWASFSSDPTTIDPYSDQVEGTFAPYGGRYLRLRNHLIEILEGDWQPPLGMAIVEFPSMQQARDWYNSAAYAPLRDFRRPLGRWNLILVDGMPEGQTLRSLELAAAEQARAEQR